MNVRVAILAAGSYVAENGLDVALDAGHRLVHAAQRIPRLVVIELRDCAEWLPRARGMAILAGHGKVSMRAVRASRHLRMRASRNSGKR